MTMQVIQRYELTSDQSEIEFTNIPQTFTDLMLLVSGRATGADVFGQFRMGINGTFSNTIRMLQGAGSSGSVGSYTSTTTSEFGPNTSGPNSTANTFGSIQLYIPNYAGSSAKSISYDGVMENNATESYQNITAGLYNSSTAISSLQLRVFGSAGTQRNWVSGSSATLYGITKGSSGGVTVS